MTRRVLNRCATITVNVYLFLSRAGFPVWGLCARCSCRAGTWRPRRCPSSTRRPLKKAVTVRLWSSHHGRHELSPNEESSNKESPNKESPNKESSNKESRNKESPNEKSHTVKVLKLYIRPKLAQPNLNYDVKWRSNKFRDKSFWKSFGLATHLSLRGAHAFSWE